MGFLEDLYGKCGQPCDLVLKHTTPVVVDVLGSSPALPLKIEIVSSSYSHLFLCFSDHFQTFIGDKSKHSVFKLFVLNTVHVVTILIAGLQFRPLPMQGS